MLYLPYGPYDGTAAPGTIGQSKAEIKGKGERDREREKESGNNKNWTRSTTEASPTVLASSSPFHHPQISSPSAVVTVLPKSLGLARMEGSPTWTLPKCCSLPTPQHRLPTAGNMPFIWRTPNVLVQTGHKKPLFPEITSNLPLPQNKISSSLTLTNSLQEDPPPPSQTYCQSTASSS